MLIGWVLKNWQRGLILETVDSRLGEEYCAEEMGVSFEARFAMFKPDI